VRAKIIAHEMRNPLAAIYSALELLRISGSDPAIIADVHGRITRQAHQLTRLVNDLLAGEELAHSSLKLHRERVDLLSTVRSAIETTRPLFEHLGHHLTTAFPATTAIVDGDAGRLTQAFVNLLDNAARYTEPHGYVAVSVESIPPGFTVKVADNGIGIAAELLPRVFDMCSRGGSEGGGARAAGMGVGLAVVRSVIEAHDGTITASSDGPGKGSMFTVQLPAARPDVR
jgi:signal transduction histidine kinase